MEKMAFIVRSVYQSRSKQCLLHAMLNAPFIERAPLKDMWLPSPKQLAFLFVKIACFYVCSTRCSKPSKPNITPYKYACMLQPFSFTREPDLGKGA